MASKKRERLEVIYDILIAIKNNNNELGPTRLLYSSNLSSQMFKDYINELISKDLIIELEKKQKKYYSLSKKGIEFINKYKEIKVFIDNFGL